MQVNDVRLFSGENTAQAADEAKVKVAAARGFDDADCRIAEVGADGGTRRADQYAVQVLLHQAREQVGHLLSAAIQVHPGFDVQDFHAGLCSIVDAVAATLSGVSPRMQV